MSSASAGWYVDPSTGTNLRFWDGNTWTDEVAPLPYDRTPRFVAPATVLPVLEPEPDPVAVQPEPAVAQPDPAPDPESEPVVAQPDPEPEPEPAVAQPNAAPEPDPEPEPEPVVDMTPPDEPPGIPDLDPEVENTLLTRRELRARRGTYPDPDDRPKHLSPITLPAAVSVEPWVEPVEGLDVPAQAVSEQPEPQPDLEPGLESESESDPDSAPDPVQRRWRIVRMSVLLGVLAVVSSVAVLTAGTI